MLYLTGVRFSQKLPKRRKREHFLAPHLTLNLDRQSHLHPLTSRLKEKLLGGRFSPKSAKRKLHRKLLRQRQILDTRYNRGRHGNVNDFFDYLTIMLTAFHDS
jgi:hypothetical protein